MPIEKTGTFRSLKNFDQLIVWAQRLKFQLHPPITDLFYHAPGKGWIHGWHSIDVRETVAVETFASLAISDRFIVAPLAGVIGTVSGTNPTPKTRNGEIELSESWGLITV